MRLCAVCGCEDRPWYTQDPCTCGAEAQHDPEPSPTKHAGDCHAIAHEVVNYPVRMAKTELTPDKHLGANYTSQGWRLIQNGLRYYRVKLLCRSCIVQEDLAQQRRREYQDACRATRGIDNTTYAQFLAQQ